jgi:transposase InsO family protein
MRVLVPILDCEGLLLNTDIGCGCRHSDGPRPGTWPGRWRPAEGCCGWTTAQSWVSQALQRFCYGKIALSYIPPGAPRLNGKVERSHRIDAEEFYALRDGLVIDDAKIFNNKLRGTTTTTIAHTAASTARHPTNDYAKKPRLRPSPVNVSRTMTVAEGLNPPPEV